MLLRPPGQPTELRTEWTETWRIWTLATRSYRPGGQRRVYKATQAPSGSDTRLSLVDNRHPRRYIIHEALGRRQPVARSVPTPEFGPVRLRSDRVRNPGHKFVN